MGGSGEKKFRLVFDERGLLAKYPRWCLYIELP